MSILIKEFSFTKSFEDLKFHTNEPVNFDLEIKKSSKPLYISNFLKYDFTMNYLNCDKFYKDEEFEKYILYTFYIIFDCGVILFIDYRLKNNCVSDVCYVTFDSEPVNYFNCVNYRYFKLAHIFMNHIDVDNIIDQLNYYISFDITTPIDNFRFKITDTVLDQVLEKLSLIAISDKKSDIAVYSDIFYRTIKK